MYLFHLLAYLRVSHRSSIVDFPFSAYSGLNQETEDLRTDISVRRLGINSFYGLLDSVMWAVFSISGLALANTDQHKPKLTSTTINFRSLITMVM